MVLKSIRLSYRPITYKDSSFIMTLLTDPLVSKFNDFGHSLNQNDVKELIQWDLEQSYNSTGERYIILNEQALIGSIGLFELDKNNMTISIGFELLPDYWNNGYMYEALEVFISIAKRKYNATQINAKVDIQNIRCINLLIKMGFKVKESTEFFYEC